ncbi:proton-conducting transporter membrane subunit [Cytophagales bacterium LB-30]|uniref:Probable inorganic carbon transporter subunit DabB n=1 Tax=Shiella aurantiaca TaxID=3058365 RepID=A0ABT8F1Y3_9BACT|nr:proton-conducting transporter membrane subunit [Shiella aurantiaca]MDN4164440.1 proton-conducting transporter membrane subunit [Shiella aurantiaca]
MTVQMFDWALMLAPLAFALIALASWFYPKGGNKALLQGSRWASVLSIAIALWVALGLYFQGDKDLILFEYAGLGIGFRLDSVSVLLFGMIALIGFVVVRYSINYMDGEQRQGSFMGRLAATIASVQLLVLSGNLLLLFIAWVLTSVCLHRLLVFYPERAGGLIAAKKKFIMARLGDVSLFVAFALLYQQFGTGHLTQLFQQVSQETWGTGTELAAIFIALAAVLKSAQFPTHGWLIEVMETPTPVSALLHAGLLNGGPFLIIRMAQVMEFSTAGPSLLIAIGGFTALFASLAFLTQSSVKTALSYSSVAHMGFSLFACGLGAYSAAMLHLVAHSFYKAHAFLSSGSAIDTLKIARINPVKRLSNPWNILWGLLLALGVYAGLLYLLSLLGIVPSFGVRVIGSIIVMGMASLLVSAFDSAAWRKLLPRTSLMVLAVATSFFVLETSMHKVIMAQLPASITLHPAERLLSLVLLGVFGLVVVLQMRYPDWSSQPRFRSLAVHVKNGLYANALFDRWINALAVQPSINKKQKLA